MELFTLILKVLVPVFLAVGMLHLLLGARADVLLGAKLPNQALADPAPMLSIKNIIGTEL